MKKVVIVAALVMLLVPAAVFAQSGLSPSFGAGRGTINAPQYMNILPPYFRATMGCCVAPFNKVWIDRSTPLIWTNASGVEVKIKFGKGDKCEEVTETGLRAKDLSLRLGCYVTSLANGKTLSMLLPAPGAYEYSIEFTGDLKAEKPQDGAINVF